MVIRFGESGHISIYGALVQPLIGIAEPHPFAAIALTRTDGAAAPSSSDQTSLRSMLPAEKCVYDHVVYQSDVERNFAQQLERNEAIKIYAKLPGWFKVPTLLGAYNPDWAVLVEQEGDERLYFVVETKSSLFSDDLRRQEAAKITCGAAHFEAIGVNGNPARFRKASAVGDLFL